MAVAPFIDHTILKPSTTLSDIEKLCSEAVEYGFAAVCIPPHFLSQASRLLQHSNVKLATVISFPFGYQHYSAKVAEIKEAIKDKANEVDMVMNIAAFKNRDFDCLKKEISAVTKVTNKNVLLKVIIESGLLTDEEIISCCSLYKEFPVDFLKTSTGYAEKGASIEAVQILRANLPARIQVKASGGIKTFEFAQALLEAGATRLGCSASVAICSGEKAAEGGY